jgi:hypothetical protein
MVVMKFLMILVAPVLVFWIACFIVGASWYYYMIMWPVGLVFGFLFLAVFFWIKGSSKKTDLKRTWE